MATSTHHEHKSHAPTSIGCLVITCSDTRTPETDTSGYRIMHMLKDAGHAVVAYHLVKDEPAKIKAKIKAAVTTRRFKPSSLMAGQESLGGIRRSKRWMPCWRNDSMVSARCFAI